MVNQLAIGAPPWTPPWTVMAWQGKPGHGSHDIYQFPWLGNIPMSVVLHIVSVHIYICIYICIYIYICPYTYILISNSHAPPSPPSPPSPAPVGLNEFQTPVVHNDLVSLVTILICRNQPIVHFEDPLTSQNPPEVRWSCTTGETNGSLNTK